MIFLEALSTIIICVLVFAVIIVLKLVPYILIALGVALLWSLFEIIYYSNSPDMKLSKDNEIPIEDVTFTPRNLLEEMSAK